MKQDMRKLIKKAAKQIFAKDGFNNISMRNIATKINYSPTTIYLYYKNKDDLIRDILADYHEEFQAKMAGIICSDDDVLNKLKAFLLLYINQSISNPQTYKLLISYRYNLKPVTKDRSESSNYQILKGFVTNLIMAGVFEDSDPDFISQSLWLHCYGIATLAVYRPEMIDNQMSEFIEFSINKIIESFRRK